MVPTNDLIENAINVSEGPYPYSEDSVQFNHATFTNDATDGNCSVSTAGVWYKFTALTSGNVEATILNNTGVPYIIFFSAPDENVTNGLELTFVNQSGNDCSKADGGYILMNNNDAVSICRNKKDDFLQLWQ